MKKARKQIVGNIQFIVESNFKSGNASTVKDILSKIMINQANDVLRNDNILKSPVTQN